MNMMTNNIVQETMECDDVSSQIKFLLIRKALLEVKRQTYEKLRGEDLKYNGMD